MSCPITIADAGPKITGEVLDLVGRGWSTAQAYAASAVANANGYLTRLSDLAYTLSDVDRVTAEMGTPTQEISELIEPDTPDIGTLPDSPTIGEASFAWTEDIFSSELLTAMRSQLLTWVNGASTGLAPAVEARLWDRARAREHVAAQKIAVGVIAKAAGRGWRRPPGAMFVQLDMAAQEERNALSGASREIAIKQAELEQTNRQFAFTKGWDVEGGMQRYIGESQARSLDAAKFLATLTNDVYRLHIEKYVADVKSITDIYKTRGDVFQSIISGRSDQVKAQAEVFKTQAEFFEAQATVQIEAAKANIQVLIQKVTMIADVIKAGAQVSAQLAASSLSAVNLHGGISASENTGDSFSLSTSTSSNCSDIYQHSDDSPI